jgi:sugar O-acyltransferase (sialic acid O-acetyltransferase NeuD family)
VRRRSRLVLVGAGGAGREVLAFAQADPQFLKTHDIGEIAFVDDIVTDATVPVIGTVVGFMPEPNDVVLCTITVTSLRRSIVELLASRGAKFISFIHETAVIGPRVTIGPGAIIYPFCLLTVDISIGAHAFLNTAVAIGHDVIVGDHVTVSGYSQLLGGVHVEDDAWFGTATTTLPGARIGSRSRVGAGSLVLRRVRPDTTVFGNPARTIS